MRMALHLSVARAKERRLRDENARLKEEKELREDEGWKERTMQSFNKTPKKKKNKKDHDRKKKMKKSEAAKKKKGHTKK